MLLLVSPGGASAGIEVEAEMDGRVLFEYKLSSALPARRFPAPVPEGVAGTLLVVATHPQAKDADLDGGVGVSGKNPVVGADIAAIIRPVFGGLAAVSVRRAFTLITGGAWT